MIRISLLALLLCEFFSEGLAKRQDSSYITNGYLMQPKKAPFVVSIQNYGTTICGGAIITPTFVLTAAHCLDSLSRRSTRIHAGEINLQQVGAPSQLRYIKRVIPNPKFDFFRKDSDHDIGLIEVSEPFYYDYANVAPIALSIDFPSAGLKAQAIGWGALNEDDVSPRNLLRGVDLIVASDEVCTSELEKATSVVVIGDLGDLFGSFGGGVFGFGRRQRSPSWFFGPQESRGSGLTPEVSASAQNLICADGAGRSQGVCSGDSGGPLYTKDSSGNFALLGVVSFSLDKCEGVNSYDFFTAVAPYLEWINQTVINPSESKPKPELNGEYSNDVFYIPTMIEDQYNSDGVKDEDADSSSVVPSYGSGFGGSSYGFGASSFKKFIDQFFGNYFDSPSDASDGYNGYAYNEDYYYEENDSYSYVDEDGIEWEVINIPIINWG